MNCKTLLCKFIILSSVWVCSSWRHEFSDFYGKFKFYWNIPTFMCKRFNVSFDSIPMFFRIIQNKNDSFRGEEISTLYDPGAFPSIKGIYRNGGLPQKGNLSEHLNALRKQIPKLIPDPNYSGLAIIDAESWKPILRQNWGRQLPYKAASKFLERNAHPNWTEGEIEKEATWNFEVSAKHFMLATLKIVKKLRPKAKWGYYGYPHCYNNKIGTQGCADRVTEENNKIRWLFQCSDILLPSVYIMNSMPRSHLADYMKGRVVEALRLADLVINKPKPKVFAFHRYVFTDTLKGIDIRDIIRLLTPAKESGADGIILWGSSFDLNTKKKCEDFFDYLLDHLGPAISLMK